MQSQSSFTSGMTQDIGKNIFQNTSYFQMLNGSIITDEGLTSGLPTNIKGNELFITIPDIFNVTKLVSTFNPAQAYNFTLTINGITTAAIIGSFSDTESLYLQIQTIILSTPLLIPLDIHIFYNNNYMLLYSPTVDLTIVPGGGGSSTYISVNELVPAQTGLFIIGWGTIREDIYLFTTNETNFNPTNSAGQIWKLTYNKSTLTSTLELKYNNILNFTVQHPIPNPGGFIGRYETNEIQRIYWTDNFNPLRSLNMGDPMVFATDLSLVNAQPSADFDIPLLQKVSSGGSNVPVGAYQLAYRLKTANGSFTAFSEPSNIVFIVPKDEELATGGSGYIDYIGANQGTSTSKQITWKIHNLDIDYSRIECCIIRKESLFGVPAYEVFLDEPIDITDKLITYGGQLPIFQLSQDEFTALSSAFTHCKTIASKDNYLFAGNVRHTLEELSYDARAFRFPVGSSSTSLDGFTYNSGNPMPPETDNCINDYPYYPTEAAGPNQVYQAGNSVFGGTGPFISYKFGTLAVPTDTVINFPPCWDGNVGGSFRHTNQDYGYNSLDFQVPEQDNTTQSYPLNNINAGTKFAYYSSTIRDYQNGETYRFGIQFFDKSKNPYYVKWIGDIKFPNPTDDDGDINDHTYLDGGLQPYSDYRTTFTTNHNGSNKAYTKHIFVKFQITVPNTIIDLVSGYTIVRVKREDADKTILGTGILNSVQADGGATPELYLPENNGTINYAFNASGDNPNIPGQGSPFFYTFECPDFKFLGFTGVEAGDELRVTQLLDYSDKVEVDHCPGTLSVPQRYRMIKWYDNLTLPVYNFNKYRIEKASVLNMAQSYFMSGVNANGWTYHNYSLNYAGGIQNGPECISLGCRTLILELLDPLLAFNNVIGYNVTLNNQRKLYCVYYRRNANQYGGNTYSQRSLNNYISCMGYRPIGHSNISSFTDTIKIFGGDVFTTIYDEQRAIKCYSTEQGALEAPSFTLDPLPGEEQSASTFYPVKSFVNTDLRHGRHPNSSPMPNTGDGTEPNSGDTRETYEYNITYSSENIARFYFPKPSQVVSTTELDNRIYNSDFKVNGELQDSWRIFKEDNHIDVDGNFGPINQLINFNNLLYFWQAYAVGSPAVNARSLIQDTSGASLTLGTGDILSRYDYLSTTIGTKHQFSFAIGKSSVAWLDITKKKYYKLSNNGVQELSGLNGFLNTHLIGDILINDNPYTGKGATSTYDYNKNEFIFTCSTPSRFALDPSFTVGYLDIVGQIESFHSFYSFKPATYVSDIYNIFSSKIINPSIINTGQLWLHDEGPYGSFYDQLYPFSITVIVNPHPEIEKIYDSMRIETEALKFSSVPDTIPLTFDQLETFTDYRMYTDYGNTNWIPMISPMTKQVRRGYNTTIAGNQVLYNSGNTDIFDPTNINVFPIRKPFTDRIKGPYAFLELRYNNTNNNKLTLQSLVNIVRINERSTINI